MNEGPPQGGLSHWMLRDDCDLYVYAGDEVGTHRRAHRSLADEVLQVLVVERGVVGELGQVHHARDDDVERRTGTIEQRGDVVEDLRGLGRYAAATDL